MKTIIRHYKRTDEESLKKCIRALKEFESQFDPDYLTTEDSVQELFIGLMEVVKKNQGAVFVAEVEEKGIMGFISLEISVKNAPEIVKKVNVLYVSDLVVLPEFRSLGIGEALLMRAEQYAKELGISYLKLIVFADSERVRSFYQRTGFKNYEITMLKEVLI
jgi:ribosomal protein S18 acetylase RimI-like enzyme